MPQLVSEKIWDPVTRLWHWVLVLVIVTGWGLGEFMDFDTIKWHFYLGYCALGLLGFRLLWGMFGPKPIRLSSLFPSPKALITYLRSIPKRTPSGTPGHNPVGALSVIAMLFAILTQAVSGLFIESDDFFEYGPLAGYVSESVINRMTWIHHLNSKVILVLVALHVSAIVFYLIWKRENLVKPMITGWKLVKKQTDHYN